MLFTDFIEVSYLRIKNNVNLIKSYLNLPQGRFKGLDGIPNGL